MLNEYRHKIIRISFVVIVFALFALMFWPFFTSILLAALFAFALHRTVDKITYRKISRSTASLLLIFLMLVFIAAPSVYVILKAVATVKHYANVGLEGTALYQSTMNLLHNSTDYMTEFASKLDLDLTKMPQPVEVLQKYSGEIGSFATNAVAKLPRMALNAVVFFLALYYFLIDSKRVKQLFLNFDLLSEYEVDQISNIISKSSHLTLVASIIIGNLQALVLATFAYFCGFTDFFLVYIVTFIFSLIPVIGSAPVGIFLILISFIEGNVGAGIAMSVAAVIVGSLDNLLKPLLLNSDNDNLHPVVSLLAIIGSVLIYGPIGILLGPILTQLAFNIHSILSTEEKTGDF